MAEIKTFRDLKVWQKAHQLVLLVYRITTKFPAEEIGKMLYSWKKSQERNKKIKASLPA